MLPVMGDAGFSLRTLHSFRESGDFQEGDAFAAKALVYLDSLLPEQVPDRARALFRGHVLAQQALCRLERAVTQFSLTAQEAQSLKTQAPTLAYQAVLEADRSADIDFRLQTRILEADLALLAGDELHSLESYLDAKLLTQNVKTSLSAEAQTHALLEIACGLARHAIRRARRIGDGDLQASCREYARALQQAEPAADYFAAMSRPALEIGARVTLLEAARALRDTHLEATQQVRLQELMEPESLRYLALTLHELESITSLNENERAQDGKPGLGLSSSPREVGPSI